MAERTSDKKLPKGVRFVGTSIEINFQVKGMEKREQFCLPYPQTPAGITASVRTRSELIAKAKLGILTEADIAKAKGEEVVEAPGGPLFQDFAQKFLKYSSANIQIKKEYRNMLMNKWMPIFALMLIESITTAMLREAIDDYGFENAKTKNNNLVPLRGVFDLAIEEGVIFKNPMLPIKNDKVQEDDPDPFSKDEMIAMLDWLKNHMQGNDVIYYHYFEVAFFTGCRPSELLALQWRTDFDKFNKTLSINKSRVRGLDKNVTKTHTARIIHLHDRAYNALLCLFKITGKQNYIFICPESNEPFYSEKPPRLRLQKAMQALGIRDRRAYNTRHTYATLLLTSGVNPFFASTQMGHSLQMMLKRYAKWIDVDKSKAEIAKVDI